MMVFVESIQVRNRTLEQGLGTLTLGVGTYHQDINISYIDVPGCVEVTVGAEAEEILFTLTDTTIPISVTAFYNGSSTSVTLPPVDGTEVWTLIFGEAVGAPSRFSILPFLLAGPLVGIVAEASGK